MRKIIERFKFYSDLSEDLIQIQHVNKDNMDNLFSNWEEEKANKPSLFTDLLLLSNK